MQTPHKRVLQRSQAQNASNQPSAGPSTQHTDAKMTDSGDGDDLSARTISATDWTLEGLLHQNPQFKAVQRVSALASSTTIEAAIRKHEASGEPLIIERFHEHPTWPQTTFNVDWLLENYGHQGTNASSSTDRR